MKNNLSFAKYSVICCGTLSPEMNVLKTSGFLDVDRILYIMPGLHENPRKLSEHLSRQLQNSRRYTKKVIVVYGSRCYIDPLDPEKSIDKMIRTTVPDSVRINAKNCIDMLVSAKDREKIADLEKVYWLSPGWLKYWRKIFKQWDIGLANETFPKYDKAVVLDGIGYFDYYLQNYPEELLEFSDWMKIPVESFTISLDRLKGLLADCLIDDLQRELSDLKAAIPAHSIQPSMYQELEDLEEKLNKLMIAKDKIFIKNNK